LHGLIPFHAQSSIYLIVGWDPMSGELPCSRTIQVAAAANLANSLDKVFTDDRTLVGVVLVEPHQCQELCRSWVGPLSQRMILYA
jgi:hypothetical protein